MPRCADSVASKQTLVARLLLALLTAVFVLSSAVWIHFDTLPPLWDSAHYLWESDLLYKDLTREGPMAMLERFATSMGEKAPLITLLPIPAYALLGAGHAAARYTNLIFIIVACVALNEIGRRSGGPMVGLLSVLIVNTYPIVAGMSRQYLVEYALMTFTIVWMYLLVLWEEQEGHGLLWGFGVLAGFGLLLKITFPLYVGVPTLWIAWRKYSGGRSLIRVIVDLIIIALIATPIAAIWYTKNLVTVLGFAASAGFGSLGRPYGSGSVFTIEALSQYWLNLINFGTSFGFLALTVTLGVILLAGRRRTRTGDDRPSSDRSLDAGKLLLLILWLIVPILVLSFAVNKDLRYVVPSLPALAVLTAYGLTRVPWRGLRIALIAVVVLFGLANYALYSACDDCLSVHQVQIGPFVALSSALAWAHPPISEDWPLDEIVGAIAGDLGPGEREPIQVRVLFSHPCVNAHVLKYVAVLHDLPLRFHVVRFSIQASLEELIAETNERYPYVIKKSDALGPKELNTRASDLADALDAGLLDFDAIATQELPDGSYITIFRNRGLGFSRSDSPG